MQDLLNKSVAQLEESLGAEIKLGRNPIVAANNKSMPKIYGLRKRSKKQVKSRVYEQRKTHRSMMSEEILEVVRMQVHPNTRVQKQVLSAKCFTLEQLADRVHTPKSKARSGIDSPINRLRLAESDEPPTKPMQKRSIHKLIDSEVQTHHIVLDRLRRVSPLPHENQTSHKVVRRYIGNAALPPIVSEQEQIATTTQHEPNEEVSGKPTQPHSEHILIRDAEEKEEKRRKRRNWSEQSKKIRMQRHSSFFIEEESESDGSSANEISPSRMRRANTLIHVPFEKKITISDPRIMQETGTGMEKVTLEIGEFTGNTYFYEMTKKEPFERLKLSRTKSLIASRASSQKFQLPAIEELSELLKHYSPVDVGFDLKLLLSSEKFKIVKGKGFIYSGEVENGKPHGMGLLFSEKTKFEGEFANGQKVRGSETTSQGMYRGFYKNGLREGDGEFIWNNKEVYTGQWKNGMKHGKGRWSNPAGDYYEGGWVHNKQEGEGIHNHRGTAGCYAGNIYRGQFINFKKHGQGSQQLENGDQYEGEYVEGKPNGLGSYTWADGSKYTGEFRDGMRQGLGVLERDGNLYRGSFNCDFKDGDGQIFYKDGSSFKGRFREDKPTTDGEYKCADGSPALFDVIG